MSADEPLVRMRHVRQMKGCGHLGTWWHFFEQHGLSRREFVKTGIPAGRVEATGDAMAIAVARCAREEASRGG